MIESGVVMGSKATLREVRDKLAGLVGRGFPERSLARLIAAFDGADGATFLGTTVKIPFDDIPTMRGALGSIYSDNALNDTGAGDAFETWILCTDEKLREVQHRSIVEHLSRLA